MTTKGKKSLRKQSSIPTQKGSTSESVSPHLGGFKLLRGTFKDGQCHECATLHEPEHPHNQQSMFWQYNFMEKNGRWPTWNDALAHCSQEMRDFWVSELANHGVKVDDNSVGRGTEVGAAPLTKEDS